LGTCLRMPVRVGKAVTQEEVAEAAGISRVWYAMMEGNRPVRVSSLVLGRLANVLAMETAERAALFQLVLPEVGCVSSSERSLGTLEAFQTLRPFTRRLWEAATEKDVLRLVREICMGQFHPDLVVSTVCGGPGIWNEVGVVGDADAVRRLAAFHAFALANFSPAFIDEMNCADALHEAGDVVTRSNMPPQNPRLAMQIERAHDAVGWRDVDFMVGRMRSRRGFVANVAIVHNSRHRYTESDQTQLGAISEIASLALS
jgi:transcriptional regulator with XRE-family HTH domain